MLRKPMAVCDGYLESGGSGKSESANLVLDTSLSLALTRITRPERSQDQAWEKS